jgi:hypothetical protein
VHLENRVTPFGMLVADSARGLFMGNRGNLLNEKGELTKKRWAHKSWVTCTLTRKDDKKAPKDPAPVKYTKLFFLDEATALAAGHRPCSQCRRKDFIRFFDCWIAGNDMPEETTIMQIDAKLHSERISPQYCLALIDELPNGVFVAFELEQKTAWLIWNGELLRWQPEGYSERREKLAGTAVFLLTPLSTVNAIAAGYIPHVHQNK